MCRLNFAVNLFGSLELSRIPRRLTCESALSEDTDLIAQVVAGHTNAFEGLVRKYQDRLYNTLIHVTGSTHDAEEVTQEAMLRAYTRLDSFRGGSSFYTWLYRIAFNVSVSRERRKRPRHSLDETREQTGMDPVDGAEQPDAVAEQSERARQMNAALSELSEEYRNILVLREFEDQDYDTIASILEIPVGTVRSRLYRARTMLRDRLKQTIDEP